MNETTKIKASEFFEEAFSKTMKTAIGAKSATEEAVLDYCLLKAWKDAALRERFNAGSPIIANKEKIKLVLKQELLHSDKIVSDFELWHSTLCKNGEYGMKYGIWQKFINMTFKYMFCCNVVAGYFPQYDSVWAKCHCPIDSIIAKITCELLSSDTQYSATAEELALVKSISVSGTVSWNTLNEEQYNLFQKQVKRICDRESVSPLEFDFLHWEQRK